MSNYSACWRMTILAAVIFHLVAGFVFAFVLPEIFPTKLSDAAEEMTWLDVDLTNDFEVVEEEIPIEAETIPESEFEEIVMPELVIPETIFEPLPEIPPPPPPLPPKQEVIQKPVEPPIEKPPQPTPPVAKPQVAQPVAKPKVEEKPVEAPPPVEEETEPDEDEPQQMGEPPVTIEEFYPKKGSGLGYKGFVSVAVTIDKNGNVKATKIMRTSGRMFVDSLAEDYATKWKFKPAMDQNGKPMECDKIITFDFKKFA